MLRMDEREWQRRLEREYTPHKWKMYELYITNECRGLENILEKTELDSCGAGSQVSIDHFHRTGSVDGLFFYDTEQIFMDLDKIYGVMKFGRLTREWRGHPIGALVLI